MPPRNDLPAPLKTTGAQDLNRRQQRDDVGRDLDTLARWLDTVFEIPVLGFRFGLDAVIGLLPGAGDLATSAAAIYILSSAQRMGVSKITLTRMTLNIVIDLVVGSLPFVGDLFDAYWKSNTRNVDLLRRYIAATPETERKLRAADRWFVVGLITLVILLTIGCVVLALVLFSWLIASISGRT